VHSQRRSVGAASVSAEFLPGSSVCAETCCEECQAPIKQSNLVDHSIVDRAQTSLQTRGPSQDVCMLQAG
jgi:hypothetical protein